MSATFAVLRSFLDEFHSSSTNADVEDLIAESSRSAGGLLRGMPAVFGAEKPTSLARARAARLERKNTILHLLLMYGGSVTALAGDYDTDALSVLHLAAAAGNYVYLCCAVVEFDGEWDWKGAWR